MDPRKNRPGHMRRTFNRMFALALVLWTVICAASYAYYVYDSTWHIRYLAHESAVQSIEKDMLYRHWAAQRGGVYVPEAGAPRRSPNRSNGGDRTITTSDGRRLMLLQPEAILREVHALGRDFTKIQGRYTSLRPVQSENAPDAWEIKALKGLEGGAGEFGEVVDLGGTEHYRLMVPMVIEQPCLACHGAQGYKLGDLRGGISASVPMSIFAPELHEHKASYTRLFGGIWLLGLIGVAAFTRFVRRRFDERETASESLRRNWEFTQSIIENEPECVNILGPGGLVKFMNRPGLAMFDADSLSQMFGQPFHQFVVPEHREAFISLNEKVFAGENGSLEFEMVGLKGTRRWLETYVVPLRDTDGTVESLLGITRDVTEHRRAEQSLRESESKFVSAFRSSPNAMAITAAADGVYFEVNDVFIKDTGYTRDEVIGHSSEELRVFVDHEDRERLLTQVRDRGSAYGVEMRFRVKSGEIRTGLISTTIITMEGRPHFLSTIVDITARKKIELALRESEERFRSIFDDSPIAIWEEDFSDVKRRFDELKAFGVTDMRSYLTGNPEEVAALAGRIKIREINNSSVALLGAASKEEVLRDLPRYFTDESLAVFKEEMIALFEGKTQFKSEISVLDVSGMEKLLDLTVAVQPGHEGTLAFVLVSFIDITEHRRLEQQLLQAQRIESVGRLAGGVAHDINNMLTPILGYAELLEYKLPSGDPMRDDLDEITSAAKRVRNLTRQLLAFARKQTLEMVRLDLNEVVTGFTRMLQMALQDNIVITVQPASLVRRVMGDKSQLEQVIMNLAVNAQDAMPSGGTFTLATRDIEVDEAHAATRPGMAPGPYVQLLAIDSGIGMDEATQMKIFDPFFTTKEAGRGTGLGLATVYGIVKQHGGYIEVRSRPGSGSTFVISLPVNDDHETKAAEIADTRQPQTGSETILVVEDQELVLRLVSLMLRGNGYHVLTAMSGGEALRTARAFEGTVHLVVSDVIMPDMNGKELFEELRKDRQDVQILYMSGYPADVISSQGVLDSGINFIRKPFGVQEFSAKVRQVLDSREA